MGTIILYKKSVPQDFEMKLGYSTDTPGDVLKHLSRDGIIWEFKGHANILSTETNQLLPNKNHHGLAIRECNESMFGTSITESFDLEKFLKLYAEDKAVKDAFVPEKRSDLQVEVAFANYLDITYRNPMNKQNLYENFMVCFDNLTMKKRKPTLFAEMEAKIGITLEASAALFGIKDQDTLRKFFEKHRRPGEYVYPDNTA